MKISTRIALVNVGFITIILMLLGLAWFEFKTLDAIYNRSKTITTALRNQVEADMMHDGLRADVLYAIKLAHDGNDSGKEEALATTSENIKNFKRLIRELEQANLSDVVNQKLAALKEPLERYTSSADQLTKEAFANTESISEGYKSFEKDFEYLEGAMAQLSDVVEKEFASVDERVQTKESQIIMMIGLSAALAFGIAGLSWFSTRSRIIKPISSMTEVMSRLSQNDLDATVPYTDFKDEIGQMASAVQIFKENALETLRIKKEQEQMEKSSVENRKHLMDELAHQFEGQVGNSIQSLAVAAERLQGSAKSMESTARTTQEASSSVAAASEETSANVATVASATEEMTASSQEISKQVANVAAKASEAADSANTTNQQVTALNTLVSNIGEVVTSIKNIAEQTNLLALNATIEAARAGESGKGFAVVADEVKKLATETAKKTEEIENRISEIQRATQASVQAMQLIIRNVSDIDNLSASAAAAVEEQNATIAEITRNISEVSSAARDVASVIGSVQQGAVEVGQSAESLLGAADSIASLSDNLEHSVSAFLEKIRSDSTVKNA